MNKEELNEVINRAVEETLKRVDLERKGERLLVSRLAVAKRLDVHPTTLWRWGKRGYLRPVKIGGSVFYKEVEIQRLENGLIEP